MDLRTIWWKNEQIHLIFGRLVLISFFVQEIEALERVDCKVQKIRPK